MKIIAILRNNINDKTAQITLPIYQDEFAKVLIELGLYREGMEFRKSMDGLPITTKYELQNDDTYKHLAGTIYRIINAQEPPDFIAVNMLAIAMEDVDYWLNSAVDAYAYDETLNIYELCQAFVEAENINFTMYERDEGEILANFGRTFYDLYYGDESDMLYDYVNWYDYGNSISYDYTLTDHGFLNDYDVGISVDDFTCNEDLCNQFDWSYYDEDVEYNGAEARMTESDVVAFLSGGGGGENYVWAL